ncbi:unnamed protein product [Merluccius merluccius]
MSYSHTLFMLDIMKPGLAVDQEDPSGPAARYQPALQPSQSESHTGTYTLRSAAGKLCLKATMGVGFTVVVQKKAWYFSVDPSMVLVSGSCGPDAATLTLTLPDHSASLQLTYTLQEDSVSYVSRLTAHISPLPVCSGCSSKTYLGELTNTSLFVAPYGQSYRCTAQSAFVLTQELQVKLVPLQTQAFKVPDGGYGQEVMCQVDFNSIIVPTVLWATAAGLALIAMLTYLVVKDRRPRGYERL